MLIHLFILTITLSQSPYYDIPAYYGHFSLNYFEPTAILSGQLVSLQYHFAADATYDGKILYFAHEVEHCIYSYNSTSGDVKLFAGNCGTPGNIVGSATNTEFNGVSSLAYFRTPSSGLLEQLQNVTMLIVANSTCDIQEDGCIIISPNSTLTMDNLRLYPQFDIYQDEPEQREFLYVADTANHCIKRIEIAVMEVTTVAGQCGSSGFLDGPMGYNRMSYPRNLGISRAGTLYFFDSGNEYMRILTSEGSVKTLLLGACKEKGVGRTVFGYTMRQILCYENWIEYETGSSTNHYFDPSTLNVCTQQASQCPLQTQ